MKEYNSIEGSPEALKNESKRPILPVIVHEEGSFVSNPKDVDHGEGSSVFGASLNFTNVIVGAGCMGIGGAIANSGGLPAVVSMTFFAYLSKLSFDLVLELAVQSDDSHHSSYEGLAVAAFGRTGRFLVVLCKALLSYSCLVAYIVIVKDNFAPAITHLVLGSHEGGGTMLSAFLRNENLMAALLCAISMLPLCLLRDMAPLEKFAAVKIITVSFLVAIVAYLYLTLPQDPTPKDDFFSHWLEIRSGFIQSLGTFVYSFVAQHTVHMVYKSLKPEIRSVKSWKQVSTLSISLSALLTFSVGLFVYMTFWDRTTSNIFELYPSSHPLVHAARILLCIMMVLTYPASFFACREMFIIMIPHPQARNNNNTEADETSALVNNKPQPAEPAWWLIPGEDRQLIRSCHVIFTAILWGSTLWLALAAPSLGDVMNLSGCSAATGIAFLLPGLFSFKLRGYTHDAALILFAGGIVGIFGTYLSLVQLLEDCKEGLH